MSQVPDYCYIRSAEVPEGAIMPKRQARISPDDRGFYFADGVYEVMRTYGGRIFRLNEHLKRFRNSLRAVQIELPDVEHIGEICVELMERNGFSGRDVFFYIQATRGVWQRNLLFPPREVLPTLYISVTEIVPPVREREQGIRVITVEDIRWQRCDIKAIGLLASVLARNQAQAAGAEEAIFVRNGVLTEGTHTNLFLVKNGRVFTHPLNRHILPGVTRTVVLELCAKLGIEVIETGVREDEISAMDEIFVTSTTWEVVPVVMVNGQPVGAGVPGVICRTLQAEFRNYVTRETGSGAPDN
ncbi:MAG: aminotransferase class IV [candidate division WOR-3 bacterium]|nr:aminotransferase class IV [candidate division WOR-3 bacterium]